MGILKCFGLSNSLGQTSHMAFFGFIFEGACLDLAFHSFYHILYVLFALDE